MIVQNVHMENYANYLIPTLIQNLIWILILIQQNENQSAYFGNSTFSIFTGCCCTKSLDNGDLKKDSIVVVNESKEHNRNAALTCLKKVIDKAEEINVHIFL